MAFADLLLGADAAIRSQLGEWVTYDPGRAGVSSATIRAVFDPALRRSIDSSLPGVVSVGPAAWVLLADLPCEPASDPYGTITRGGVVYRIREVQKDNQGSAVLHLVRERLP